MHLQSIKTISLIAVVLLLLISCSTPVDTGSVGATANTDTKENVLSGELIALAINSISIRTDSGMEYCFAIDDTTLRDEENLSVGDRVSVRYSTDMAVMAKSIEIEAIES